MVEHRNSCTGHVAHRCPAGKLVIITRVCASCGKHGLPIVSYSYIGRYLTDFQLGCTALWIGLVIPHELFRLVRKNDPVNIIHILSVLDNPYSTDTMGLGVLISSLFDTKFGLHVMQNHEPFSWVSSTAWLFSLINVQYILIQNHPCQTNKNSRAHSVPFCPGNAVTSTWFLLCNCSDLLICWTVLPSYAICANIRKTEMQRTYLIWADYIQHTSSCISHPT